MEKKPQKYHSDAYYYKLAFRIAADFGVTLAVPAVIAALLGKWLDNKWDTAPWITFSCLAIAFALTAMMVTRKAKIYGRLYEDGPEK